MAMAGIVPPTRELHGKKKKKKKKKKYKKSASNISGSTSYSCSEDEEDEKASCKGGNCATGKKAIRKKMKKMKKYKKLASSSSDSSSDSSSEDEEYDRVYGKSGITKRKCNPRDAGVRRCSRGGCYWSSKGAGGKCNAYGGVRRCDEASFEKLSKGASGKCVAHGGGWHCEAVGCDKYGVKCREQEVLSSAKIEGVAAPNPNITPLSTPSTTSTTGTAASTSNCTNLPPRAEPRPPHRKYLRDATICDVCTGQIPEVPVNKEMKALLLAAREEQKRQEDKKTPVARMQPDATRCATRNFFYL
jgi:hypothetical protein